ncbi:exodeoxyribonuclease V gamma subunit [Escherichia coli]|uniref:Exodeoxyribonuclease V gamma subunit n=1 Tax=Escherichia coli TaxID=562 RepID=A0A2X1Q650_ECOLX|nr:exodeoxyribonuclease V gamma subunit [Escherichia coli]
MRRYLFLEALISAQQKSISAISSFHQDNSERFPSYGAELIDYIGQSHYLPGDERSTG